MRKLKQKRVGLINAIQLEWTYSQGSILSYITHAPLMSQGTNCAIDNGKVRGCKRQSRGRVGRKEDSGTNLRYRRERAKGQWVVLSRYLQHCAWYMVLAVITFMRFHQLWVFLHLSNMKTLQEPSKISCNSKPALVPPQRMPALSLSSHTMHTPNYGQSRGEFLEVILIYMTCAVCFKAKQSRNIL